MDDTTYYIDNAKGYLEIDESTDLDAIISVLRFAEESNNGYIWALDRLTDVQCRQLPAMHRAGLIVLANGKVFTPESYRIHAR